MEQIRRVKVEQKDCPTNVKTKRTPEVEHVGKLEIKRALVSPSPRKKTRKYEWFQKFPRPEIRSPRAPIWIYRQPVSAIVDSGATTSIMSKLSLAKIFQGSKLPEIKPVRVKVLSVDKKRMKIDGQIKVPVKVGPMEFNHKFLVFYSPAEQILMGYEMMKRYDICLYPGLGIGSPPNPKDLKRMTKNKVPVRASQHFYLEPGELAEDPQAVIRDRGGNRRRWAGRNVEVSSDSIIRPTVEVIPSISQVTPRMRCKVSLVNNSSKIKVIMKNQIIGHAYRPEGHEGEGDAELVKNLEKDDFGVQTAFFMSPPKWHL